MKKEGADRRPLFCTTGEYYGKRAPTEELYAFLRENSCDAILCTHVFSAMQLTHLLQVHPMDVRTFFVATDYTCSPGCGRSRLDKYFIPNAALAEDFIAGGVPAQKLIPSSIPVRQTFCQSHDKGVAKMRQGIEPSQRHLLIMCGSMGCGPMAEIAVMLSQNMPENFRISVVCGRNKTLRRKLTKALAQDESVFVRGYVKDMASLMDSADLYLTKPGGSACRRRRKKGCPWCSSTRWRAASPTTSAFLRRWARLSAEKPRASLQIYACAYCRTSESWNK